MFLLRAQVQLFADTFTEQLSYMGMLRADSAEAFETAKQKFITGLTVSTLACWHHAKPKCVLSPICTVRLRLNILSMLSTHR